MCSIFVSGDSGNPIIQMIEVDDPGFTPVALTLVAVVIIFAATLIAAVNL